MVGWKICGDVFHCKGLSLIKILTSRLLTLLDCTTLVVKYCCNLWLSELTSPLWILRPIFLLHTLGDVLSHC